MNYEIQQKLMQILVRKGVVSSLEEACFIEGIKPSEIISTHLDKESEEYELRKFLDILVPYIFEGNTKIGKETISKFIRLSDLCNIDISDYLEGFPCSLGVAAEYKRSPRSYDFYLMLLFTGDIHSDDYHKFVDMTIGHMVTDNSRYIGYRNGLPDEIQEYLQEKFSR